MTTQQEDQVTSQSQQKREDAQGKPRITSLSLNKPKAGDTVTINGVNFGSSEGKVLIDANEVIQVLTWADTSIDVQMPNRSIGNGTLTVQVPNKPSAESQPFSVVGPIS